MYYVAFVGKHTLNDTTVLDGRCNEIAAPHSKSPGRESFDFTWLLCVSRSIFLGARAFFSSLFALSLFFLGLEFFFCSSSTLGFRDMVLPFCNKEWVKNCIHSWSDLLCCLFFFVFCSFFYSQLPWFG